MEIPHRKRAAVASSFFPVDEGLLPHLNISREQHEELRRYALQAAMDTVHEGPTWGRTNIERAVASGWRVFSARPTACFLIKQPTRRGKSKRTQTQQQGNQLPEDNAKRTIPPAPTPNRGSFHGSDIACGQRTLSAPELLNTSSGHHFMVHTVLPNSLEDVMNTVYCEHTREMRALKHKIYGEAALDCCVLQTLEGATLEDPFWYLGLKWLVVRSPMHALLASREFVYLEHLGTHVDPETGRQMLYRVTQSVHVRDYGGHDSYFGLTRGHIEATFVYWLDDDIDATNPLLHMCVKGRIHMKGRLTDALVYKYLKALWCPEHSLVSDERFARSITVLGSDDIEQASIEASKKQKKKAIRRCKVLNGPPLEMAQEWVANGLRPRCSVCKKKFRFMSRSKHHCRACGEVICRDCTFRYRVNVRATQSFCGLRATVTPPRDLATDFKAARQKASPVNFEETMTCSFDNQVEDEEGAQEDFDTSLSFETARKAVDGPTETAVLGGDSVVCIEIAKVCLSCLHSVSLVNRSTQQRRHTEIAYSQALPGANNENDADFGLYEDFRLHHRSWTPDHKEVEELDGLDDALRQVVKREQDLPMLVVNDEDTESVDGLAGMGKAPGPCALDSTSARRSVYARRQSYAQEWIGQEDGSLDTRVNNKRVMILSPHALSTSCSHTPAQLNQFKEKDESSYTSSARSTRASNQHSGVILSDTDNEDNHLIQFVPTRVHHMECKPEDSPGRPSSCTAGFDPNSLFDLNREKHELAAAATATECVMRRMRDLQNDTFYLTRHVPSPSMSTISLCSDDEGTCNEIAESMQDLRQALAQVEHSLAD